MNKGTQLSMFPEENVQAVSSFSETINVPAHQRKKKRTQDDRMNKLSVVKLSAENGN